MDASWRAMRFQSKLKGSGIWFSMSERIAASATTGKIHSLAECQDRQADTKTGPCFALRYLYIWVTAGYWILGWVFLLHVILQKQTNKKQSTQKVVLNWLKKYIKRLAITIFVIVRWVYSYYSDFFIRNIWSCFISLFWRWCVLSGWWWEDLTLATKIMFTGRYQQVTWREMEHPVPQYCSE